MPQTRFVLGKSLELNKRVLVVVNKIDRPAARPDWVVDTTFDLFCDLGATDEQCDFPVVYASGLAGKVRLAVMLSWPAECVRAVRLPRRLRVGPRWQGALPSWSTRCRCV